MNEIAQPGFQISQIVVLMIVLVAFSAGLWCRGVFETSTRMSSRQFFGFIIAGFLLLGLPLCPAVFNALVATNNDLFVMLSAIVPPFVTGLSARKEIEKQIGASTDATSK